jgi:uncharacterized protein YaiE (UPF0345 family)
MKQTNRGEYSYGRSFKSGGQSRGPAREEWRCHCCGKLLGVPQGDQMHIRMKSCQEYLVAYPQQPLPHRPWHGRIPAEPL